VSVAAQWHWPGGDSCIDFFTAALTAANPDLPATARVLEIGCAEADWLTPASKTWPAMTFAGIDWRGCTRPGTVTQGDVRTSTNYPLGTFDWIVSISAIEHVGLGHYDQDPRDEHGDSLAIRNAYHWLKPGGWLYFDVPWNAGDSYEVCGSSHRIYDDIAIQGRLLQLPWREHWRGWARRNHERTALTTRPTERLSGCKEGFYYIGLWLQKPATSTI
jgi:SAM-dependent methyltransferase